MKPTSNGINIIFKMLPTFIAVFIVVGLLNQSFYNFCMQLHCLSAALSKVTVLSVFLTSMIYLANKKY